MEKRFRKRSGRFGGSLSIGDRAQRRGDAVQVLLANFRKGDLDSKVPEETMTKLSSLIARVSKRLTGSCGVGESEGGQAIRQGLANFNNQQQQVVDAAAADPPADRGTPSPTV